MANGKQEMVLSNYSFPPGADNMMSPDPLPFSHTHTSTHTLPVTADPDTQMFLLFAFSCSLVVRVVLPSVQQPHALIFTAQGEQVLVKLHRQDIPFISKHPVNYVSPLSKDDVRTKWLCR